jgi:hypothetical protein
MGLIRNIGRAVTRTVTRVVRTVSTAANTAAAAVRAGVSTGSLRTATNIIRGRGGSSNTTTSNVGGTNLATPTNLPAALNTPLDIISTSIKGNPSEEILRRAEIRPTPQPVPDPNPILPPEEIPGDPKLIPGEKGLDQNAERYSDRGGYWQIQAEPQIVPLELVKGMRPELKPVLIADGVVVKVGDEYLCSKRTLADILNSDNPHYDIAENGRVLNRPMGRSVPIIQVDISKLKELGDSRDRVNRYAGVKSVDYLNESEAVPGTNISQGLLNQLNWTMVEGIGRWPDRFEVWDIMYAMQGNYSVRPLVTSTMQEEDKLDKKKLEAFLIGMDDRLARIRRDFNMIKRMFYNGDPPTGTVPTLKYYKIAKTIDPADEESKNAFTETTSRTIRVDETPISAVTKTEADAQAAPAPTNSALTGASAQRNTLVAKWQSYKWTVEEANGLKGFAIAEVENPPTTLTRIRPVAGGIGREWIGARLVTGGPIIGISHVRWTAAMLSKGSIVDPFPVNWMAGGIGTTLVPKTTATERTVLTRLYGNPPFATDSARAAEWWAERNAKRQAEIIRLAYDIRKIEEETATTIPPVAPPGVTVSGGGTVNTSGKGATGKGGK